MSGPSTWFTETVERVPGVTLTFCTMLIPSGFTNVSVMDAVELLGFWMLIHSSNEPSVELERVVPYAK